MCSGAKLAPCKILVRGHGFSTVQFHVDSALLNGLCQTRNNASDRCPYHFAQAVGGGQDAQSHASRPSRELDQHSTVTDEDGTILFRMNGTRYDKMLVNPPAHNMARAVFSNYPGPASTKKLRDH